MLVSRYRVARSPDRDHHDLDYDACLAPGPTVLEPSQDALTVLSCRRTAGHTHDHGNHAGPHSRAWRRPYMLIQLEGHELSLKHPRARGRIPRGTLDHLLLEHGHRQAIYTHLRATDQVPGPNGHTAIDWTALRQRQESIEQRSTQRDQRAARSRKELLERELPLAQICELLEADPCPHVDPDQLDPEACRGVWITQEPGHTPVAHPCHNKKGHRDRVPRGRQGHRCHCVPDACGRTTRANLLAYTKPTERPDQKLPLEGHPDAR